MMAAERATPTEVVSRWLEQPEKRMQLEKLVRTWDDLKLLGIDLADQLRELVRVRLAKEGREHQIDLDKVDWLFLAEQYAFEIRGITEEELTRRRVQAQEL